MATYGKEFVLNRRKIIEKKVEYLAYGGKIVLVKKFIYPRMMNVGVRRRK
jgi:hypothetical protein